LFCRHVLRLRNTFSSVPSAAPSSLQYITSAPLTSISHFLFGSVNVSIYSLPWQFREMLSQYTFPLVVITFNLLLNIQDGILVLGLPNELVYWGHQARYVYWRVVGIVTWKIAFWVQTLEKLKRNNTGAIHFTFAAVMDVTTPCCHGNHQLSHVSSDMCAISINGLFVRNASLQHTHILEVMQHFTPLGNIFSY
jgi:hypothetical protein